MGEVCRLSEKYVFKLRKYLGRICVGRHQILNGLEINVF